MQARDVQALQDDLNAHGYRTVWINGLSAAALIAHEPDRIVLVDADRDQDDIIDALRLVLTRLGQSAQQ